MSKLFLGLALAFSIFMLLVGLTSSSTKPAVLLFWLLIGGCSAYKLFSRTSQAS
jgi:hypothetical protein